jgi:SPP1 family predicted phage head-tail adaptor
MRAGQLDRTIELQSVATAPNSFGELVETWTTFASPAAAIVPTRGNERFTAQQLVGHAVTTFRIRYRTGLTVLNRIVYDGRQWDIHDVREIGRREGLEIDASARSET